MSLAQPELDEFRTTHSEKADGWPPAPSFVNNKSGSISSIKVGLIASVCAVLTPSRMLLGRGAPNDSGVFAYIGWAMNRGLVPYKDIWDHKGPLLYYLQFAGIRLFPPSTFGIGLLELIALSIAFYLLLSILAAFASHRVIFLVTAVSLFFVAHFCEGGNLTESWALLPLAAAHFVSWSWAQRTSGWWCALILGVCFACIIWLRPNMAIFPVVAMLVLLHRTTKVEGLRTAVLNLIVGVSTATALTCLILAPIFHYHAFREFVEAYFEYNAAYSRSLSLSVRFHDTVQLVMMLFASGLALLGIAGWALGLRKLKQNPRMIEGLPVTYVHILLFSLPLELSASCLGGRTYSHYLLPLFPTLAMLAAFFLREIENKVRENAIQRSFLSSLVMLAFASGLAFHSLTGYAQDFSKSVASPLSYLRLAHFIRGTTRPSDKIIVVGGAEAAYVTYYSQRLAASRFVYQYPLVNTGNPDAADQRREFLDQLIANRPAVAAFINLGFTCFPDMDCDKLNEHRAPADNIYDPKILPDLLRPLLASEYYLVQDPRVQGSRVFVRRDLAMPSKW